MANSIDLAALGIGVALGYGLRDEIRGTADVCKKSLLAGINVAAQAAVAGAEEASKPQTQTGVPQGQNGH